MAGSMREADEARVAPWSARWHVALAGVILAATVLMLGVQNRRLRQTQRDLMRRFTQPHPGMLVPDFLATTLAGDTVTIGASGEDGRQVLFFFTTTCLQCRNSWPGLAQLEAALARHPGARTRVFAVGLDSVAAIRRFADSARLSVPVVLMPSARLPMLYRIRAVPQLVVLDSGGRTVFARAGTLKGTGVVDSIVAATVQRGSPSPAGISFTFGRRPDAKSVTTLDSGTRR